MADLSLHLHFQGFIVAQVFLGLWLFPFGICVIQSRFIPRILGIFLIAGRGYAASSLAELGFPRDAHSALRSCRWPGHDDSYSRGIADHLLALDTGREAVARKRPFGDK